jgi:TatD DNase family protein
MNNQSLVESLQSSLATLIDTHCHLEMDEFNSDREEVIQRARNAGVAVLITIGSNLKGNKGAIELSEKYEAIYAAVGIHPHDAKDFTEEIFNQLKAWTEKSNPISPPFNSPLSKGARLLRRRRIGQGYRGVKGGQRAGKVVAIGEIGLDYHYDNSPREIQKEVFKRQLSLAKEIALPVVIHSREAKKDTLEIVRESGIDKGVFHCFSGDMDMAEEVMAMGFHISIAGPVTFKNAKKLVEIAKFIPDDFLLIETDAPYLTPEPFRGRRNEPSYLVHIAKTIAELREISMEDLARITTLNARRLFGVGQIPERGEISYKIRDSLYLNITNRCTNRCCFCVRFITAYVKGHNLQISHEPTEDELKDAIGDPSLYKEVVFCGYGEPLIRLDLVKSLSKWIKQNKGTVRINTNGHGNLIHGRNILPELKGIVDSISISLDAHDEETYDKICRPIYENAFKGVIEFIRESKEYIPHVEATVVEIEGVDIEKCREITDALGVRLRIRKLHRVG